MPDVIISGAGPTGTMLASELRLHDVDVAVLERDAEPPGLTRALGLHPRGVELLAQRGILDRFLARGTRHPGAPRSFAGIDLALAEPPSTAHDYVLGIPQPVVDALLEERAAELGADVHRGVELIGLEQDDDGVTVVTADGSTLRAGWLVGCDGGRSVVRRLLDIRFPGEEAATEWLLAEFEATADADEIARVAAEVRSAHRGFGLGPGPGPDGGYRGVVPGPAVAQDRSSLPDFDEFRERLRAIAGTDFGAHAPRRLSRFTDATRQAEHYRVGRGLVAGDAAHVHPPLGGQGLGLGLQDAVNLGWKLAAVVNGWAPDGLLDSYERERHPAGAEVLSATRAQSELVSPGAGPAAARRLVEELARFEDVRRSLVERVSGTSVRYDLGGDDDLVGRRLPDVPLTEGRLFDRMHAGRGLLLDRDGTLSVAGWRDRVDHVVDAGAAVEAQAVLVRPDGHVAWAGDRQDRLTASLTRWFGTPTAAG